MLSDTIRKRMLSPRQWKKLKKELEQMGKLKRAYVIKWETKQGECGVSEEFDHYPLHAEIDELMKKEKASYARVDEMWKQEEEPIDVRKLMDKKVAEYEENKQTMSGPHFIVISWYAEHLLKRTPLITPVYQVPSITGYVCFDGRRIPIFVLPRNKEEKVEIYVG